MNHLSDEDLSELIRKGSISAFETLFYRYWNKLYLFAFRMTGDNDLAQNIIQDLFVEIWEKRLSLHIKNIESYLFQSVKFQVFKRYRDQKLNPEILEERFEDFVIDTIDVIPFELKDKLLAALNDLPVKRKQILEMNKIHGLSIDQIAEELGIAPQTVKNQLVSAIKQLRTAMNGC